MRPARYDERFGLWPGEVGLELEMLPVRPGASRSAAPIMVPLHVPDANGESLAGSLLPLAAREGWNCEFSGSGPSARLLKIGVPGASSLPDWITFEPGGQIEFSSAPFPCLSDALNRLVQVRDKVARHLRGFGIELVQTGINPWYTPEQIGLQMDKPRYVAMNKYFSRIGPFGPRMMRQTCTVQVNLDFGSSEDEMARRYLVSLLIAPFAGATFANSPYVDGKAAGVRGFRSKVWLNLDPSRTGIAPVEPLMKALNRDACVRYYWDFAKNARVVFVAGAGYSVPDAGLTWEGWMQSPWLGVSPTLEDFETHLSLLFPEVRPRGFLEQRPVDCQHPAWVAAPAGYYTGLLYDARAREQALALLEPFAGGIGMLLHKVPEGFKNSDLAQTSARLMELAIEGLDRLPECFRGADSDVTLRRFYERFTARRRVPADDLIDAVNTGGLGLASYLNAGDR
ncbi:MAG: hypothetical protein RIQ81_1612 [Pseudomonadota bacterium]